jgi:hypothetical protein
MSFDLQIDSLHLVPNTQIWNKILFQRTRNYNVHVKIYNDVVLELLQH